MTKIRLFPRGHSNRPLHSTIQRLLGLSLGLLLALTTGLSMAGAGGKGKPPSYGYFVTGDPQYGSGHRIAPTTPSFVLMGGGPDVDEAFRWMITRAGVRPGSGGRFVVIRATGTEAYNPYIFYSDANQGTSSVVAADWIGGRSLGLGSVETLVVSTIAAANDPFVNDVVAKAQAVFIAGGDQADYINNWKGTQLDQTLRNVIAAHVPVGGTSAGLAVLGQFDFAALRGSVDSSQALADPYNKYMTLDPSPLSLQGGFLAPPSLADMIFDSHLDTRDRMGRMISFVARLVAERNGTGCSGGILDAGTNQQGSARAIGIGVETALLVEGRPGSVTARRVTNPTTSSESAVYFVRPLIGATTCAPRKPLSIANVEIVKLADSQTIFDLSAWTGKTGRTVDVLNGQLTSNPY